MFREYGAFVKAYMLNVSNGGLFVKTEEPFPLDHPVSLRLILPSDKAPLDIEGRVVWINPKGRKNSFPKGMGIQFEKMDDAARGKLDEFVEKYQKEIQNYSIL
jgi:type IV pilus assembly protein PilZ